MRVIQPLFVLRCCAVLLGLAIWAFCRFYYFRFYVIENHVLWRPESDSPLEGTPNKFVRSKS